MRPSNPPAPSIEPLGASAQFRFMPSPGDVILRMTKHVALVQRRSAPSNAEFTRPMPAQSCTVIAFHRSLLRLAIDGHAAEVVSPNYLSLHRPGSVCSRQARGTHGEASDCIVVSSALMQRICNTHGVNANAESQMPFAHPFAPCTPTAFLAQRRLFTLARSHVGIDSRAIERAAWVIVQEAVQSAQRHAVTLKASPDARCSDHLYVLVEEAKVLLAGEFMTKPSLQGLAPRLHCSRGHLSRAFRALTGYRLVEYRNELRLRRALTLMEEYRSDVADIATGLGFVNRSHFSRMLRKGFGITPMGYIRNLSGDARA
jgi:AraC-like DNA-binding protein